MALITNLAMAQPPAGKANVGDTYGAKIDRVNAVAVKELPSMFKGKDTIPAKVMGKVLDVCSSKGCWLTMQVNDSTKAFKSELFKLHQRLKILEKKPFENRAFLYLDVISWLESKIENRPMLVIIQEKYKRNLR